MYGQYRVPVATIFLHADYDTQCHFQWLFPLSGALVFPHHNFRAMRKWCKVILSRYFFIFTQNEDIHSLSKNSLFPCLPSFLFLAFLNAPTPAPYLPSPPNAPPSALPLSHLPSFSCQWQFSRSTVSSSLGYVTEQLPRQIMSSTCPPLLSASHPLPLLFFLLLPFFFSSWYSSYFFTPFSLLPFLFLFSLTSLSRHSLALLPRWSLQLFSLFWHLTPSRSS